jgi:uncharacterized RDD family membrane protein YckC
MNSKKIYSIIAVVFAITYVYNLFWFVKTLLDFNEYAFQFSFFARYISTFIGIAGVIIFFTSQFKRSNLLRLIMCFEIMSFPFLAFWYFQFLVIGIGPSHLKPSLNWTFVVGCVINFSLIVCSIIGLRMLSLNKTAKLSYSDPGAIYTATFSPAPAGLRFVNRLVDVVMILYILFINAETVLDIYSNGENIGPEIYLVLEIPFLIFYYLALEGLFNTSAGKAVTGTTIVNENGERPRFMQIVGRTFCRLIPFEAFSFFGAVPRGWHDTLSNTYVVESINKEDAVIEDIILDVEINNQS